jgi:DNA-binding NtrC family response regulator
MPPMRDRVVLVVDDDVGMIETLTDILEASQCRVSSAHSGKAAISMAAEGAYDAVLMDIRMPDVNGVEALRAIKARAPGTRVIMMTAYTGDELAREAERMTGMPVLPKPLDVAEVLDLVARRGTSLPGR